MLRWLLALAAGGVLPGRESPAEPAPPGSALPPLRFVEVQGVRMAYRELGTGSPIVFLHGNPTSSLLWRSIMPCLADRGRCIAPDLAGMGDSAPLPGSGPGRYSIARHRRILDALLRALDVRRDVVLVVHDWGGMLGFDWGRRHAGAVRGIAFMECFVVTQDRDNTPAPVLDWFRRYRTPEGARAVLEDNEFVEKVLLRQLPELPDSIRAAYRRPFAEPGERRRPMLEFAQQVPLDGDPGDVHRTWQRALAWMAATPIPKLFVSADPGALVVGRRRDICRAWPNVREVTVRARHFVPEDAPAELCRALDEWWPEIGRSNRG